MARAPRRGGARPAARAIHARRAGTGRAAANFSPVIGELREGPLHRALKDWLARPGDRLEVPFEGYVIDLVRADGELVEVQTGGFAPLRSKLDALLDRHRVRIVHPVPARRSIVR